MQTLRAYLRDGRVGPGVSLSIPIPPVGKPVPQYDLRDGTPYRHAEVTSDGGLLYLRMWTSAVPAGTHVYTVPKSSPARVLTDLSDLRRKPRS